MEAVINGLPMPDAVSVLVSTELLAQLEADWSPPVQLQVRRTPGIGSGYEMTARSHARPNRKMSESGQEQTVVRTEPTGQRVRLVLRQVGWIGQTGDLYALGEDPSPTEPGGFGPLWFMAHGDVIEDAD